MSQVPPILPESLPESLREQFYLKSYGPALTAELLAELRLNRSGYLVIIYKGEEVWSHHKDDKCQYVEDVATARRFVSDTGTRKFCLISWHDVWGKVRIMTGVSTSMSREAD